MDPSQERAPAVHGFWLDVVLGLRVIFCHILISDAYRHERLADKNMKHPLSLHCHFYSLWGSVRVHYNETTHISF